MDDTWTRAPRKIPGTWRDRKCHLCFPERAVQCTYTAPALPLTSISRAPDRNELLRINDYVTREFKAGAALRKQPTGSSRTTIRQKRKLICAPKLIYALRQVRRLSFQVYNREADLNLTRRNWYSRFTRSCGCIGVRDVRSWSQGAKGKNDRNPALKGL